MNARRKKIMTMDGNFAIKRKEKRRLLRSVFFILKKDLTSKVNNWRKGNPKDAGFGIRRSRGSIAGKKELSEGWGKTQASCRGRYRRSKEMAGIHGGKWGSGGEGERDSNSCSGEFSCEIPVRKGEKLPKGE